MSKLGTPQSQIQHQIKHYHGHMSIVTKERVSRLSNAGACDLPSYVFQREAGDLAHIWIKHRTSAEQTQVGSHQYCISLKQQVISLCLDLRNMVSFSQAARLLLFEQTVNGHAGRTLPFHSRSVEPNER